jgi:hypothetical protein
MRKGFALDLAQGGEMLAKPVGECRMEGVD